MPDTATPNRNVVLDIAQMTEAGGRPSNQDAMSHGDQNGLACFVVSDGVGGEQGGEVAAQTVVEAVIDSFTKQAIFDSRSLESYVEHAAARLEQRRSAEEQLKDMSATVAMVLIDQSSASALWGHMGDSRIYFFRQNKIRLATKDHSLVQQLVDAGYCKAEQLRRHPHRSTLCAALGAEGSPEIVDTPASLLPGDAILICTDGFWEWIDEQEMEQAVATARTAQEWLLNMRATVEARARHSRTPADNYTAFTIYVADAAHG